ncbi:MAG TPA: type I-U CRISPR-associated protein Csx17 [Desulfobulbus sp.]|nr:type I-U CRISPR-associated protein Csx17 [Desulfobulbus sp.]
MIHAHHLYGCTPTPLANVLKALGVLRLVAEQEDRAATACWQSERFVLRTILDREELENFFLEQYRPSPIVAPWNGGSGFYPGDNQRALQRLAKGRSDRFSLYRQVIGLCRTLVAGRSRSPKNDEKEELLRQVRALLPDPALAWLDAAVLLGADKSGYPPLLGTGGNDGRLDFTNNFMQQVVEVISPEDGRPGDQARTWLRAALDGSPACGLVRKAVGQFAPGRAGGPNSTTGFEGGSRINPWDFILMLEGSLLFAGAVTRRLESSTGAAPSFPFTVRTTGSGIGSVAPGDEKPSRAEIWMPLWHHDATLAELRMLFTEGRLTVGRRPAADGLDAVRAVGCLGVDRGIAGFQRFGFLMRAGKAYLATPLGRYRASRSPGVELIAQLDRQHWLERLRQFVRTDKAPAGLRQLVRRLEDTIFGLARDDSAAAIQDLLILLGRIQAAVAAGAAAREQVSPMPMIGPEWVEAADDATPEFRLACGLAGLEKIRPYVLPLPPDGRGGWKPDSVLAVWSGGDPVTGLTRILERRLLEARRDGEPRSPFAGRPAAGCGDVMRFLYRRTDDHRLAALFAGLVNARLPVFPSSGPGAGDLAVPAAFRVFKPLFTQGPLLQRAGVAPEAADPGRMGPLAEIVRLLVSGSRYQAERALNLAWRQLRNAGLRLPPGPPPGLAALDGSRLAAALMIPLDRADIRQICGPFKVSGDRR